VTQFGQHPPHLAILPFGEHHLQNRRVALLSGRSDVLCARFPLSEPNSLDNLVKDLSRRMARDDHAVDFFDSKLRMCQPVGELAIVRQQYEANAHFVQPAHGINALRNVRHEINDPRPSRRIAVRRDVTLRFVHGQIDRRFHLHPLAVNFNAIPAHENLRPELTHDLPVDRHATLQD
jgi:hypothetical protein